MTLLAYVNDGVNIRGEGESGPAEVTWKWGNKDSTKVDEQTFLGVDYSWDTRKLFITEIWKACVGKMQFDVNRRMPWDTQQKNYYQNICRMTQIRTPGMYGDVWSSVQVPKDLGTLRHVTGRSNLAVRAEFVVCLHT